DLHRRHRERRRAAHHHRESRRSRPRPSERGGDRAAERARTAGSDLGGAGDARRGGEGGAISCGDCAADVILSVAKDRCGRVARHPPTPLPRYDRDDIQMMIKPIIVDDEPLAREVLREYLGADEEFEIVAECANGFEAVRAVTQHDPDVLFLDIQMPKLDVFEVLDLLDRAPAVFFVTAHDEHALPAFERNALDYLLNPFTQQL